MTEQERLKGQRSFSLVIVNGIGAGRWRVPFREHYFLFIFLSSWQRAGFTRGLLNSAEIDAQIVINKEIQLARN